jgi:hypothetical protein
MLINAGLPKNLLSEYADYKLGKKIEDCLLQNGICSFDADL